MNNKLLYTAGAGAAGYVASKTMAPDSSGLPAGAASAFAAYITSSDDVVTSTAIASGLGAAVAVGVISKDLGSAVGAGGVTAAAAAILVYVGETYRRTP